MIHLITGVPGAGKTARAVQMALRMMTDEESQSRAVFSNVNGFKRAEEIPATWMEVPDGSVIVLDECQQRWRRYNANGKPPEEIAALETHRHRGIDFILTCQNPKQLSTDVRALVDIHEHVWRPGKMKRGLVARFDGEVSTDPMRDKGRSEVEVSPFKLPAEVFNEYQSASLHTEKTRVPRLMIVVAVVVTFAVLMFGYTFVHFATGWGTADAEESTTQGTATQVATAAPRGNPEPEMVEAFGYIGSESRGVCHLVDADGRVIDSTLAECFNASQKPFPQPVPAR